jgi:hypothetical protein
VVTADALDRTIAAGRVARFKGRVAPHESVLTKMQVLYRGNWRTVTQGYAGADGRFVAAAAINKPGDYRFRFLCPRTSDTDAGVSRAIRVSVD